jgi:iron complex outermembrane receptor protein
MRSHTMTVRSIALCALCWSMATGAAGAQPAEDDPAPGNTIERNTSDVEEQSGTQSGYDEVTVTATPLPRSLSDLATPADVVAGEQLRVQEQRTLGQTLSRQPGVSSTYYGPNASRPIIRGQGGERIRILNNGVSLLDASGASADHAVALDPIAVKRVDVVRGPAALLYGSAAIGGVVNAIDGRIPDVRLEGVTTQLQPRWDSASSEWGGAGVVEGGRNGFNFHLDGAGRETKDLAIPGFARSPELRALDPLPPGQREPKDRLPNSASATQSGAGGMSYVWDKGYVGFSPSWYHSDYGTVAEPDVSIDLRQKRLDVAGGFYDVAPRITSVKYKLGLTDYEHTEFEGTEPGTVFKNRGWNGRIDAIHDAIGPLQGAFGLETIGFDFSALGEEAFLPKTTTRITSGFAFEEAVRGKLRFQLGGRFDVASVDAEADPQFGPADSRSFVTGSGAAGMVYEPAQDWPLGLSLSYTSRAPNYQELYANGPHLATAAFEVGDRDLQVERSLGIDLSARRTAGRVTGFLTVFYNRYDDFIALEPTPRSVTVNGTALQVYQYRNVPADFTGGEAGLTTRLFERAGHTVDLELSADYVYTRNRDTGDGLPFIPPFRFRSRFSYAWKALQAGIEIIHANAQNRLAPGGLPTAPTSIPTAGYTMLSTWLTYNLKTGPVSWDLLLKGNNLNDTTAREATSFLKDIAPLPGVGISGGLRASF